MMRTLIATLFSVACVLSSTTLPVPAYGNETHSTGHSCNNKGGVGKKFNRDYYIYFDTNSSALSDDDRSEIEHIKDFAAGQHAQQICLFGKASKEGNPAANEALSRKRSQSVAKELQRLGWPVSQVAIEHEGEAWSWLSESLTWDSGEDRRVRIRLSY